jgi:hypothetical protein
MNDMGRYPEANGAIDAALTAVVMLIISVEGMDGIAEEVRYVITCMGDEGFLRA